MMRPSVPGPLVENSWYKGNIRFAVLPGHWAVTQNLIDQWGCSPENPAHTRGARTANKTKKVKKCKRKSWTEHNYTNNLFLQVVNLTFQITFCCFGDFYSRSIFNFCLIFNTFCLIWLAQIWFHIDQSWSGTTWTVEKILLLLLISTMSSLRISN